VRALLGDHGIAPGRYFAPIHLQPAWSADLGAAITLPVTESIARRTLALPFFNRIIATEEFEVASILRNVLESKV
jgi:perosamine synthetase